MQLVNEIGVSLKVFVSYTMRDSYITTDFLRCVDGRINSHSSSYIDILHNDSDIKQLRVEYELVSSDLMILLESESVHESRWVKRELQLARNNAIPVVRVKVNENHSNESIIDRISSEILSYKKELTIVFSRPTSAGLICA